MVTLRGLDRVLPQPGPAHLLWVISHPDEVDADEARAYDAVFAASPSWASAKSAEWGIPVSPLLQCTDPEFFHAGRTAPDAREGVLFVGNARRGSHRPIVEAAEEAGAHPRVFGTGWEKTPLAARLAGTRIANDDLGAHYAAATVVLNGHWDDMRRAGFLANRLFDAVACGARVLGDPIEGLEIFDGCVVACDSPEDVREALSSDPDRVWPDLAHRMAVAERIRTEHSFDRRAETLLARALELRG